MAFILITKVNKQRFSNVFKNNKIIVFKRYMNVPRESVIRLARANLSRNNLANVHIRRYPGEYSAGHFSYNTVDGKGKKLPAHEYGHRLVQRNKDGEIVGLLTTTPKPTFKSVLIDNQEYVNVINLQLWF